MVLTRRAPGRGPAAGRRAGVVLALLLAAQCALTAPAAHASSYSKGQLWSPSDTPLQTTKPVPGTHLTGAAGKPPATGHGGTAYHAPAVALPAAGTVDVGVDAAGVSPLKAAAEAHGAGEPAASVTRVGSSPVYVGPGTAATPSKVALDFVSQSVARSAGIDGLLMSVSRADGATASGQVAVEVDPKGLAGLYGGDFAQRLTLVELPECALSTPDLAACRTRTPVRATQDPKTGRLIADLALPPVGAHPIAGAVKGVPQPALASDGAFVLAATSAPAGSAGTYSATSLKASDQWSAGGSTGDFSYSYPISTPPSIGGTSPKVELDYSSSSVDGETVSTNAQASWIGDGWNYNPGFIERSYQPCSQDGMTGTGDTCWAYGGHEITASGSGIAGQIIWDDASSSWKMGGSDATVQLLTGAGNGAYDGEYWVVTDTDGTRYYYGAGRLPGSAGGTGSDPATDSAWTEPVYCPDSGDGPSGDSCYSSSTGTSSYASNMAYRWNLDFVVDANGNTTEYTYGTETNYYARQESSSKLSSYVRGGYLSQISYGWRDSDIAAEGAKPAPADEVRFTVAERCFTSSTACQYSNLSSSTASDWPDTPYDLNCNSGQTNCANYSESYWSTKRLSEIETYVNEGTTSSTNYKAVDDYTLNQSLPDPGDGTSPALRLDSISQTGVDGSPGTTGGNVPLPSVSFAYTALPNRVPGSTMYPAYNRYRITAITTETGGVINVAYTNTPNSDTPACNQTSGSSVLPSPSDDTYLCYEEYWTPPLAGSPIADWFEKYVVSSVVQADPTGGSPNQVTDYSYLGAPAWHRDDSPHVPNAQRSWDDFRGFQKVATETGLAPDPVTETVSTYLRGMDGDYESQDGGTQRSVTETTNFGDTVTDSNQYAGQTLETQTYSQAGGTPTQETEFIPWSEQVASHAESGTGVPNETAYFSGTSETKARSLLANGSWRTTESLSKFDPATGQVVQVDDEGDLSLVGTAKSQETCTTTDFATPPSGDPAMTSLPGRVTKVFVTTGGPVGTGTCPAISSANAVSDVLTTYDNQSAPGVIGSLGEVTEIQDLDHWNGSTEVYNTQQSGNTYDGYGRLTQSTDARGLVTKTAYTPATGTLPTSVATTDATMGWTTTETMEQARQLTTQTVDQNGNSTSQKYDELGRLKEVWLPGRAPTQSASRVYTYSINGTTAPTWVASLTLLDDNTYTSEYQIYDGFMQLRQEQTTAQDGSGGADVQDTFYDSDGWAYKTSKPYYITSAPSNELYEAADSAVPGQTLTTFDGEGRPIDSTFYSYAEPQWDTKTSYPGADRTDVVLPSGGSATSTFTDAQGNPVAVWTFNGDTVNDQEAYTPGAAVPSGVEQISYTRQYVPGGAETTTTDTAGHEWTNTYNYAAEMTASTDPDSGSASATYDAAGDQLSVTTPTAGSGTRVVDFTYDALGRRKAEYAGSTSGPLIAAWTYDTAPGGKGYAASSTSYDSSGNAYTQTISGYTRDYQPTGGTVAIPSTISSDEAKLAGDYTESMTYTANAGLLSTTAYGTDGSLPAETVTDTYNSLDQLDEVAGTSDYLTGVTYDPVGNITRENLGDMPDQVALTQDFDDDTDRMTEQFIDEETGSTHTDDITTTWNPAGQITSTRDVQGGGAATDLQCYTYTGYGQLAQAWSDTAGTSTAAAPSVPGIGGCKTTTPSASTIGGPAPYWQSYTYNLDGDRQSETDYDVTGNAANNVTHTYAYPSATGTSGTPNELQTVTNSSQAGGTSQDTYGYNPDGSVSTRQLASGTNESFTYDAAGRTKSVTDSKTGNSSSYVYDASGNLLMERDTVSGATTVTLYLSGEQITLNVGNQTETGLRYYAAGGATVVRSSSGAVTYETGNAQNTETVEIDASSLKVTRRYYTPYGETRGASVNGWVDNRGFLDQPTDAGIGLDVLGARLYDPTSGRFEQRDSVFEGNDEQQIGGYTYAANNPVNGSDATGTLFMYATDGGGSDDDSYTPDPGGCATATCAYELGDADAAGAVHDGCIVTCPDYGGSSTVSYAASGKSGVSATVTTTRTCTGNQGDFGCKPGTAKVSRSAPKYILYNGNQKCTTAQCQTLALVDFANVANEAEDCGGNYDCVNAIMGEAAQPVQLTLSSDQDYKNLGLQPPPPPQPSCTSGWGSFLHCVRHVASAVATVTSDLSDIAGVLGGIATLAGLAPLAGVLTSVSVGLGVVSAAADCAAGDGKAAAEELTLTAISAFSGGLGKAGELLAPSEKAASAAAEGAEAAEGAAAAAKPAERDGWKAVADSGVLGGFVDARTGFSNSFAARAWKVGLSGPANLFDYEDGSQSGWTSFAE